MKSLWIAAIAMGGVGFGSAAQGKMPAPASTPGFDQLKSLVGEWDGMVEGKPVHASYQLVSGGTALLARLKTGDEPEMITLFTPDGARLAVTHYCSAGNQPRMQTEAVGADTKTFSFSFVGATNLESPTAGHMHHLTVTIEDKDHFSEEWTWTENGQTGSKLFHYTRKA
ncbi:MAG TPA: hypothetical protein VMH88_15765 [Gemmatimonadales bacterium]|nr:hypothetical protein [Gemmatimonadales bacterium]